MKNGLLALVGRVDESLTDVLAIVKRAETLAEKYCASADDGYLDGVALNLHSFYSAIEKIFEDISRSMEAEIPSGPDWHRDLLIQMSAEIPGVRPPVITRKTRQVLDEFRGFRHVVRNVYSFSLDAQRVIDLTRKVVDCASDVARDLQVFNDFLVSLSKSIHP